MKNSVGSVKLPISDIKLNYYVFGTEQDGFGVEIKQFLGEKIQKCERKEKITNSLDRAVKLAHTLARGVVFPDNLNEILEDFYYKPSIFD